MLAAEDHTPAIELVDLRVPDDAAPDPAAPPAPPRPRRGWGSLAALALLVGGIGVLVGSRLEFPAGGGVALALPAETSTGHVVQTNTGGIQRVVALGPLTLDAAPGRLSLDGVRRVDVSPTNTMTATVPEESAVVLDRLGQVSVVPVADCTPVRIVAGPAPPA